MGVSSTAQDECNLWNEDKRHVVSSRSLKKRTVTKRRRSCNKIVMRRVRMLKKLVPKSHSHDHHHDHDLDQGLDGLFRDTADYILSLQMRVRVMQIMVKVLSGSEE